MKKPTVLVCVAMLVLLADVRGQGVPCGTDALHQERLQMDAGYGEVHEAFERGLLQRRSGATVAQRDGEVLEVPVVVHIIHDNGAANIPDAQVLTAIQHLNDGFANVGAFDPATGVEVGIQFCLAQRTPEGLATNGIVRVQSALTDLVMEEQDAALKDLSRWTPTAYLNIWVVNSITSSAQGPGVAGYATLPGSHGQAHDGIVVEASGFGTTANETKVTVHEAGHYLGLYHTFQGDCTNTDCQQQGDRVCDTPPDGSTSVVNCGATINTCTTDADDTSPNNPFRPVALGGLGDQNDLFINYMDYGDIACQSAFTEGQKLRMRNALTTVRSSLLSSLGCQTPCAIPFDAAFTVSPASPVPVGTEVVFVNTTGPTTGRAWSLNGTVFGTSDTASFVFAAEGTYTVLLTVEDTVNYCLSTVGQTIAVVCPGDASFTTSATSILPGGTIAFTNTSSPAIGYTWKLDGAPYSTNVDESITFDTPGIYQMFLEADQGTCINTSPTVTLRVGDCGIQPELMQWRFGFGAGLDFTGGAPQVVTSAQQSLEGVSSIADANGALLFYTNGVTVWDRNDNVMPNGTGLFGGPTTSSVHQAVIAPDPAGPGLYYIITNQEFSTGVDVEGGGSGYHYSKVDMSLNGGLGDVTEKNVYLTNSINETFAGGVHANGTDSWIAIPRSGPVGLKLFHIGPTGIGPAVNTTFPNRFNSFRPTFFHSGKRLIVGTISQNPLNVYLRIMDFDNATGTCSNPIEIFHAGGAGLRTMEISPDDSKLYTVFNDTLYQHDLSLTTEAAINASRTVIGTGSNGEMRTAPDGKIYQSISVPGLRRIHAPNEPGALCDYQVQPMSVAPGQSRLGLPLNIRGPRYSGAVELDHPAVACIGSTPVVRIVAPDADCAYTWYVNGSPVQADPGDSTLHVSITGPEAVQVRVNSACPCGVGTTTAEIQYTTPGTIDLGPDTTFCVPGQVTLGPGAGYASYLWSTGSVAPTLDATASGTYGVQVTDAQGCVLSDSITVIGSTADPAVDLGPDGTICLGGVQVLDAGPGALSYLWHDTSTEQTYTVYQPGTYWVTVTNGCGSATDTLHLTQGENAVFELGSDLPLCGPVGLELNAGADGISWLWSTGDTTSTLIVQAPGTYWVDVADERGCYVTDTVTVVQDLEPPVLICPPDVDAYVDPGLGSVYLFLGPPEVSDVCTVETTNDFTNSANASGSYPIGSTVVTWTATDENGLTTTCSMTVTVSTSVGVGALEAPVDARIHPNPSNGLFHLSFGPSYHGPVHIAVLNAVGAMVLHRTFVAEQGGTTVLDLSDRAAGLYHVQVRSDHGQGHWKLLIDR